MSNEKEVTPEVGEKKSRVINRSPGQKGGARPGAGRPKGAKTKKNAELIAAVEQSGETPLQFMLRVMRDPRKPWDDRMEMAKAAAPYVHSKLSSVEVNANVTNHEGALDELE